MLVHSLYFQNTQDENCIYKFLKLSPELLDYMKTKTKPELLIKSSYLDKKNGNNFLVLCTKDKTWKIKQANQTNTILLLENRKSDFQNINNNPQIKKTNINNNLVKLQSTNYCYELYDSYGHFDESLLPVYSGNSIIDCEINKDTIKTSVNEFLLNSPISRSEFFSKWYLYKGCEINGQAYILSDEFVSEALQTLIALLFSKKIDVNSNKINLLEIKKSMINEGNRFTDSIFDTIIHKFSSFVSDSYFQLNNNSIAQWFGTQLLISLKSTPTSRELFLIQWKDCLPPFYNPSFLLKDLYGYFYTVFDDHILYLDPQSLSNDISVRFTQLFNLHDTWHYDEFIPYIINLTSSKQSADMLISKYARKKRTRDNKLFIISKK